jgi:HSP20 family protein
MALLMRPEPLAADFDRLFNTLFDRSTQSAAAQRWVPAMDLVEHDDHFLLRADLPGLSQDDVNLEFHDGSLTVSGERKAEHSQRERGYYRLERQFGSFSRTLTLPDGIDAEQVKASFERGVLEVWIPKPEQRKPRRIPIGAASGNGNGNGQPEALEGTATEK